MQWVQSHGKDQTEADLYGKTGKLGSMNSAERIKEYNKSIRDVPEVTDEAVIIAAKQYFGVSVAQHDQAEIAKLRKRMYDNYNSPVYVDA